MGKTHLAIALGRAVVEAGHTVLFTSATALITGLSKAETEGKLGEQLSFLRTDGRAVQERTLRPEGANGGARRSS